MNSRLTYIILVALGGIGLFMVLSGITGILFRLFPTIFRQKGLERSFTSDRGEEIDLPFIARIAKTIGGVSPKRQTDNELTDQLIRAGLPFYSPAHYYGRQIAYTLLYGAFGLLMGLMPTFFFTINPLIVMGVSLAMGLWGSTQPKAEVNKKLKERRERLVVDMTYSLPRLTLHVEALGDIQRAIGAVLDNAERGSITSEKKDDLQSEAKYIAKEYQLLFQTAITGFGGDMFAEALNRLASLLAQAKSAQQAVDPVARYYPRTPEFTSFLDITVAGISGTIRMKERLDDLSEQLFAELLMTQRESASKARQIVVLAAAAQLLPLFVLIGAPIAFMTIQLFR